MATYSEFVEELLIEIAFATEATPDRSADPQKVADNAALKYRPGWVRQACKAMKDYGFIELDEALGGGPDGHLHARLTGYGIEEAERLAAERAFDLFEEMEERAQRSQSAAQAQPGSAPASDRIVRIDHNATAFKEIDTRLDQVIEAVRGQ
jgi:hypothetical protein